MKQGDIYKESFTVNDNVYNNFIAAFSDCNPLHTDASYAEAKGFKGKVMHGNILNGFISYFIGEKLPTRDVIIHSQSIHFRQPVYLNDTLQFSAEIAEVYESVKTLRFKFDFKNAEGKKVANGEFQIGLT